MITADIFYSGVIGLLDSLKNLYFGKSKSKGRYQH